SYSASYWNLMGQANTARQNGDLGNALALYERAVRIDGREPSGVIALADIRSANGDFTQAGTLVREVLDDAARERLVSNIVGHALAGVSEEVLLRVFEYWKNVDADLGKRVEEGVRAGQ
ncbi:MAG: tetratricopeptide repeat protein, partial [Rhodococcus sp. (in: high G+C Gram-positive bacteria)]